MKLTLVRHTSVMLDGNYECYGATDVLPRSTFEAEAAITKQNLEGRAFDAVFTSPLTRAVMLADFCGYPDALRDDRLREMNFGEWEQRKWTELNPSGDFSHFFDEYVENPVPGGESMMQVVQRVEDFILEQKQKGFQSVLVFCHGGVINSARHLHEQLNLTTIFSALRPYGSVTDLEF